MLIRKRAGMEIVTKIVSRKCQKNLQNVTRIAPVLSVNSAGKSTPEWLASDQLQYIVIPVGNGIGLDIQAEPVK